MPPKQAGFQNGVGRPRSPLKPYAEEVTKPLHDGGLLRNEELDKLVANLKSKGRLNSTGYSDSTGQGKFRTTEKDDEFEALERELLLESGKETNEASLKTLTELRPQSPIAVSPPCAPLALTKMRPTSPHPSQRIAPAVTRTRSGGDKLLGDVQDTAEFEALEAQLLGETNGFLSEDSSFRADRLHSAVSDGMRRVGRALQAEKKAATPTCRRPHFEGDPAATQKAVAAHADNRSNARSTTLGRMMAGRDVGMASTYHGPGTRAKRESAAPNEAATLAGTTVARPAMHLGSSTSASRSQSLSANKPRRFETRDAKPAEDTRRPAEDTRTPFGRRSPDPPFAAQRMPARGARDVEEQGPAGDTTAKPSREESPATRRPQEENGLTPRSVVPVVIAPLRIARPSTPPKLGAPNYIFEKGADGGLVVSVEGDAGKRQAVDVSADTSKKPQRQGGEVHQERPGESPPAKKKLNFFMGAAAPEEPAAALPRQPDRDSHSVTSGGESSAVGSAKVQFTPVDFTPEAPPPVKKDYSEPTSIMVPANIALRPAPKPAVKQALGTGFTGFAAAKAERERTLEQQRERERDKQRAKENARAEEEREMTKQRVEAAKAARATASALQQREQAKTPVANVNNNKVADKVADKAADNVTAKQQPLSASVSSIDERVTTAEENDAFTRTDDEKVGGGLRPRSKFMEQEFVHKGQPVHEPVTFNTLQAKQIEAGPIKMPSADGAERRGMLSNTATVHSRPSRPTSPPQLRSRLSPLRGGVREAAKPTPKKPAARIVQNTDVGAPRSEPVVRKVITTVPMSQKSPTLRPHSSPTRRAHSITSTSSPGVREERKGVAASSSSPSEGRRDASGSRPFSDGRTGSTASPQTRDSTGRVGTHGAGPRQLNFQEGMSASPDRLARPDTVVQTTSTPSPPATGFSAHAKNSSPDHESVVVLSLPDPPGTSEGSQRRRVSPPDRNTNPDDDVAYLDYIEKLVHSLQSSGIPVDSGHALDCLFLDGSMGAPADSYDRILNQILPGLKKQAERLDLSENQRRELRSQLAVLADSLGGEGDWLITSAPIPAFHKRTASGRVVSQPVARRLQLQNSHNSSTASFPSSSSDRSKTSSRKGNFPLKSLQLKIEVQDRKLQRQGKEVKRLHQENSELSLRLKAMATGSARSRSPPVGRPGSPAQRLYGLDRSTNSTSWKFNNSVILGSSQTSNTSITPTHLLATSSRPTTPGASMTGRNTPTIGKRPGDSKTSPRVAPSSRLITPGPYPGVVSPGITFSALDTGAQKENRLTSVNSR
ncbi:hypothetical protein DIPPA_06263 [Diplonema papillatum]|nr:hypothetical protein DIPPA_06263 [Diplonema papillatum]KAJ9469780.1 hypothetical protein DIPPA_06263 [Diplonema papillatum]KAJ9469781.1 hypothetical protein DIPPA_06263 [Diplonema papillatum]